MVKIGEKEDTYVSVETNYFWTAEILLLTLIFYLWREMGAIITPFVTVVNTIMIPFLLGGFFLLHYKSNRYFLRKEM